MNRPRSARRGGLGSRLVERLSGLVSLLLWLVGRSSRRAAQRLGALLGWLWFWGLPIRRRVVLDNLARAFPELDRPTRWAIAARCFRHVTTAVLETFWISRLAPTELERHVETVGLERYESLRREGRGVIALTAHVGSWDVLACSQALAGVPLNVVTKSLHADGLGRLWMTARARTGVRLLPAEGSGLAIVRALRRGEVVGLVVDQRLPEAAGGRLVSFFGHPAWTTIAPHRLAERTGAALLPVSSHRRRDGRHRVVIEAPLELAETPEDTMLAVHRIIESWVREHPEQYLWHHRRWFTD